MRHYHLHILPLSLLLMQVTGAFAQSPQQDLLSLVEESAVTGSVFCDANRDGQRGSDEMGVGGVRLASDHGWEVRTDMLGRWHLHRFSPGQHLIKVDEATLPPWASLVGSPRATFLATAGLSHEVSFGLACTVDHVGPDRVIEREGKAAEIPASEFITLSGLMKPPRFFLNGHAISPIRAGLKIEGPDGRSRRSLHMPWNPGPLETPLRWVMKTAFRGLSIDNASWQFEVRRIVSDGQTLVRFFSGSGVPPKVLTWDGTDSSGAVSVLERGGLYHAVLRVSDGRGRTAISAPVVLGISYGVQGDVLERRVLRGALLDEESQPTEAMQTGVQELADIMARSRRYTLLVEVHTDDALPAESAIASSQRQAYLIRQAIIELLNLNPRSIKALGLGKSRPLIPNITEANRALNRRVELTILSGGRAARLGELPKPQSKLSLDVMGRPVPLDKTNTILLSLPNQGESLFTLSARLPSGEKLDIALEPRELKRVEGWIPAEEDPLRHFGGEPLGDALGDMMVVRDGPPKRTAQRLKAVLPPSGATLQDPELFIYGHTDPKNRLTVNGGVVEVDPETGRFHTVATLASGQSVIKVVAEDVLGRRAVIERSVTVSDTSFFVLALADAAVGELSAHIPGRSKANAVKAGPVFIQGRGAVTFRGRIRGSKLAEQIEMVAHADTDKWRDMKSFYEQLVDPQRDYDVFTDASLPQQVGPARGPLYVMVRADDSHVVAGNLTTQIEGLGLMRYDRAVYGGVVHFEHTFEPGWATRARAFGTEDVRRVVRGHDELRGTGGSLYYLSNKDIVVGTERLWVVTREMTSGMTMTRRRLTRDVDYRVDYFDGRVHLKAPLSSVTDNVWSMTGFQSGAARDVRPGHQVWLMVDYETRDTTSAGDFAVGAEVSQELAGYVTLGGGYVHEGRLGEQDYQLYGAQVRADVWQDNVIEAEFAGSKGVDGASTLSMDGGLSIDERNSPPSAAEGYAFKLRVDSQPARFFDADMDLRVRGWWERFDRGFHALGHRLDQGQERFGFEGSYQPTDRDDVQLRFDGMRSEILDPNFVGGLRKLDRYRYGARYTRRFGRVRLMSEAAGGEHRDEATGLVHHTGGVMAGVAWRFIDQVEVSLSQEALFAGDDALLGEGQLARLNTRAGLSWKVDEALEVHVVESIRWDGDNATQVGFRSVDDKGDEVYIDQWVSPAKRDRGGKTATVMGTSSPLPGGGRAYSEFHQDSGINGFYHNAVVGIGRRFKLTEGAFLSAGYERSETFGGAEGKGSRDVLSTGLQLHPSKVLSLGGRYEIRLDSQEEPSDLPGVLQNPNRVEHMQGVLSQGLTWRATSDIRVLLSVDFGFTQDLASRAIVRESVAGSFGLRWRPAQWRWLTMGCQYARQRRQWTDEGAVRRGDTADVASVAARFTLPLRMTLTERLVFRHVEPLDVTLPDQDELLWINRFGVRVIDHLDISAEYRLLLDLIDLGTTQHGALLEVGYTILDYGRVAVGYDFHDIPRDLSLDVEPGRGGVYVRMTGTY